MPPTTAPKQSPEHASDWGADAPTAGSGLRSRRRPIWVAAGILCLVLGALGGVGLYGQATTSHTVVQVLRPVSRGEVIEPGDLGVVTVGSVPGVSVVPGDRVADLVGATARRDLSERSLLAEGAVGEPDVADGQVHIGLKLAPGRLPLAELTPGTEVLLVPVAGPNGAEPSHDRSIDAVVASSAIASPDGTAMVLDVSVNREQAELVARLAATDNLALVRTG
ncbi:SAF domain-containing protein [Enemella sp. A6]|uniref:SAF domain-containing protein n=1 Tax=Enemella sp. A6 TaxID=3440152 RepID=UPI003EC014C8